MMKHLIFRGALLIALTTSVLGISACGTPELDSSHQGWKNPLCFDCHGKTTEFPHGSDYVETDCRRCHGSNGEPTKDHAADRDSCGSCHSNVTHYVHFEDPKDCRICHAP